MSGVIKPKLDIIFKKMFTENIDLLHDFLASALKIPHDSIKNIEVQNPEILPDVIDGKLSRMDISLKVDDRAVNVEMQISKESDFKDRALFLWAKLFSGTVKQGNSYDFSKQSITVNILDFKMFDSSGFYSDFTVMERTRHEVLTDKCSMLFLELPKISREINPENHLELWLKLIDSETEEEWLMLQNTGVDPIRKAVYTLREMSDDERVRELAWQREVAIHDEASRLRGAEQRGIEKGIEKGRKEGLRKGIEKGRQEGEAVGEDRGMKKAKIAMAFDMFLDGQTLEFVKKITKLDEEALKRIYEDARSRMNSPPPPPRGMTR